MLVAAMLPLCADILRAEPPSYERDIRPVLKARCFACHGALKQKARLRLDTGALVRQGGDSGPAVIAGDAASSLILERVTAADPAERMPPEGEPLTAGQIELLRAWIKAGAKSPENEVPEADPRQHWAFQPPRRPALPRVPHDQSVRNPIDAFVEAELQGRNLVPRPQASKSILLRRVSLDLIGLPPTRGELHAFLADESPGAYERVVERLLKDPRYGERWGRHWMDVWRYSDWYGRRDVNDVRNSAGQIFRWRDWIVRSLNAGKGYDRMVQEMLAADEICPEDYDAGVATGFLIRNYYSLNPNDWMRSTVEHTGKAFLGLTFNCAHCHDHKYDPITQLEYFQLRACFEPAHIRQDRVPGEADPGMFQEYTYSGSRAVQRLGAVRTFDRQADAPTWFYTGGDERNRVKERGSIPPGVPAFLKPETFRIEPIELPAQAWYPGLRPQIRESLLADARRAITAAEESLAATPSAEIIKTPELEQAEAVYAREIEQAKQAGRPAALAGEQSLLLDASAGRMVIQHGLKTLKSLADGLTIEFQLLVMHDAHVNFQLLRHSGNGQTAGYVGWNGGKILAYQPGKEGEVEVGKYDFAAGQRRFEVTLVLQPSMDQAQLTIRSLADNAVLVDKAPFKLGGWNPIGNDLQTLCFDARNGSVAVIDDVKILPAPAPVEPAPAGILFEFEAPRYADGSTAEGIEGWNRSPFSEAGGTALVSRTAANKELRDSAHALKLAQRKASRPGLRRQAAEAQLVAARAALASLETRIAAEVARHGEAQEVDVPELARTASRTEREAHALRVDSEVLARDAALFDAEALPAADANRAKAINDATTALAKAKTERNAVQAALRDERQADKFSPLSPQFPRQSTGRRRALAEWITRRDHPLTARVAVNHIWSRHFHAPLVASMYDFGRNGDRPTHPELLDWLAVEFAESGWDMKHLHRLIVTSAAYQRVSSTGDAAANVAADPENRWLWRMHSARMESEAVRDSLLYVAGRLDPTMGGIEIENRDALTTNRRSLYYSCHPEAGGKSALGELFDAPDPLDCYRRISSIIPQQALALTNSDMVQQSSQALVKAWQDRQPAPAALDEASTAEFITAMFETILSRAPTDAELRVSREVLDQQRQLETDPNSADAHRRARESFARILLNHNDFVTVR